jgi:hypothetical protein
MKFWMHGGRDAQGLGVAVYFVSLLFEMYGIEGICGRFERIGV